MTATATTATSCATEEYDDGEVFSGDYAGNRLLKMNMTVFHRGEASDIV